MSKSIKSERIHAVSEAWKNEKSLVLEGKGTRDWTPNEQKQIINKGKANGYHGHHMKSVNGHNSKAGDPSNIQFLTPKEHLDAHCGNYRNPTNYYYNPQNGRFTDFGRHKASIASIDLSKPLSKGQIKAASMSADNKYRSKAAETAKRSNIKKTSRMSESPTKTSSKTLSSQRKSSESVSKAPSTQSKTLSAQRSAGKGASVSSGKGVSQGRSGHGR